MRVFFRLEKTMARQEIILGTPPAGLGGDTPRAASMKINAMTAEIYNKFSAANIGVADNATFVGVSLNPDNYVTGGQILGAFIISGVSVTGYLQIFPGSNSAICGQSFMDASTGGVVTRVKSGGTWTRWEVITGINITPMSNIDVIGDVLGGVERFFSTPETSGSKPFTYGWVRTLKFVNNNFYQIAYEAVTGSRIATRVYSNTSTYWTNWSVQYGTSNTTRAADGTLKAI